MVITKTDRQLDSDTKKPANRVAVSRPSVFNGVLAHPRPLTS